MTRTGRPWSADPSRSSFRFPTRKESRNMARKDNVPDGNDLINDPCDGDNEAGRDEEITNDGIPDDALDFDPAKLEAESTGPAMPPGRNPFDPAFLGLSQDFAAEASVGRKWDTIKVEKPSKSRVFRVHPNPKFRLKTTLL